MHRSLMQFSLVESEVNMRHASRKVMNDSKACFGHGYHQPNQERGI
jgi:hypothetical protein